MKKFTAFVFACICVLMSVACSKAASENECVFHGNVLEISQQHLLVEPASDSHESKSSDKIMISLATVDCPENLEIGDSVPIVYDGLIQELYPAIIPNVYSIEKDS